MIKSKYLEKFSKLTISDLPINGGKILIELLPKQDIKSSGGLYLQPGRKDDLQAPTMGIVLALGQGYVDDNGQTVAIDIKVGALVVVPDASIRAYTYFPGFNEYAGGDIALAKEADVMISWDSVEAFEAYSKKLEQTKC